jgi:hypothetical protein
MDQRLRDALVSGTQHVFSLIADGDIGSPEVVGGQYAVGPVSRLRLSGATVGDLYLCIASGLASRLAQCLSPAEAEITPVVEQDATCELLNMVVESTRTLLGQGMVDITLQPPEAVLGAAIGEASLATSLTLRVKQDLLTLWLMPEEGTG